MDKVYLKLLLIEDDEDDYALVRELLSEIKLAEFFLKWVKTYQEGLEELLQADHDACLLDYMLGSRNGLELIQEAREFGCDKPIIFLTGQGGYGVDMGAMQSGAADYLVKTQLTSDMLERSIRYSIARKEAERELKGYRNHLEDLVKERTEQLEAANEELRVEIAEREVAEEALRVSEVKYRRLHDGLMDAFASIDMDGRIKECNEVFGRCSGMVRKKSFSLPIKTLLLRSGTPSRLKSWSSRCFPRDTRTSTRRNIGERTASYFQSS